MKNNFSFIKFICLFPVISISFPVLSQNENYTDSLKKLLSAKNLPDTTRLKIQTDIGQEEGILRIGYWDTIAQNCKSLSKKKQTDEVLIKLQLYRAGALNNIGYIHNNSGDREKAISMYEKSLDLYNKIEFGNDTILRKRILTDKAQTINNLATMFVEMGDVVKGKNYHIKSLELRKQIHDDEGTALSYNNLGYVAVSEGNIKEAIEYYFASLKIREAIKDWKGLGQVYGNIAALYNDYYSTEKAIELHRNALKYWIKANQKSGVAHALNNIGTCYLTLRNIDSALFYYEKALAIRTEIGYQKGIANSILNIGSVYQQQNKFKEAQQSFRKSLSLFIRLKDKTGEIMSLQRLSETNLLIGNNTEALRNAESGLKMAQEIRFVDLEQRLAKLLYRIYSKQNKYEKALQMYELHVQLKDSLSNGENKKQAIRKEFEYQYEKKSAADSVKNAEQQKVKDAQLNAQTASLKQEKFQRYSLVVGLLMVVGGLLFVVKRFRITQKQKKIIEKQKIIVDEAFNKLHEKNKEVLDSIYYARRIQRALITSEKYIERNLKKFSDKKTN